MRSRPQTAITGIEEMDEKNLPLENLKSESPTELNRINLDVEVKLLEELESYNFNSYFHRLFFFATLERRSK